MKDITEIKCKSGLYKLYCEDCNGVYTGQTGRDSYTRINEHVSSFNLRKTNSAFPNHLTSDDHKFEETEILDAVRKRNT